MMVGTRYYSEADMMRMQRDAEERVRDMQRRARQTAGAPEGDTPPMPNFVSPNRNWNPHPKGRRGQQQEHGNASRQNHPPPEHTTPPEPPPVQGAPDNQRPPIHLPPPPPPKASTLVEDMVGRLGLEPDTLLIIGLLLILINQKADTTVILALVYLLF
jgi:hypothetical protein